MWDLLNRRIWQSRGLWLTIMGVAGATLLLRTVGGFQLLELVVLDQLFRIRPIEPTDSRIVIVTVNESDIDAIGDWPMSDAKLAELLQQINAQQPSVIGLDIFRNLPVEPGHQELVEVFTSTPNLIGIEKVIRGAAGEEIKAPSSLSDRNQVAASDLLLDVDGRIRRNLLYLRSRDEQITFGLGARLALMYLEQQGIQPKTLDRGRSKIQLGQAILTPLKANAGGYVRVDDGGYQILANFRRLQHGFDTIPMTQVLAGKTPAGMMRDRIVLIGLTADSLEDRFYTSFSTDSGTAQAGVEIHAQIASQLVSAALDGRPLLKAWPEPFEGLWIVIWSGLGAALSWFSPSPQRTSLGLLLLGTGLLGCGYLFFLLGWWVIVVPPLFALVSATTFSSGAVLLKKLQLSNQRLEEYAETLEERIEERTLELQQEKELLQAIVDHIPVMMTLYDAQGKVYFVNQELEKVLGWSNHDIKTIDLITECFPEIESRQQAIEHMTTITGKWGDFRVQTRDGRHVDTSWANVQLSNGVKIGIGQDMSERLAAERRERKQAEETSVLDERNRMAREIHDTLAQALTGILVHLETVAEEIPTEPEIAQAHIEIVQELARTGLMEARRSVAALRPQLLENRDLPTALSHLTSQMAPSPQTQIFYRSRGTVYPLPPDVETNLLRIGQEALTNAIKYAHAREIHVELVYDPTQCILRIKDDGQGFDIESPPLGSGFGLLGMSERAKHMEGELTIQSKPGQGTEITVIVSRE